MADEPTIGEVSRQVDRLETLHLQTSNDQGRRMDMQDQQLRAIRDETSKTNGRLLVAEEQLKTQGRELGEVKREQSRAAWAFFSLLLTIFGGVIVGVLVWWLTVGRGPH